MRKLYLILVVTSLFLIWAGAAQAEDVCYQVHFLGGGDATAVCDGGQAGTVGLSKALDTIKIWSTIRNICYKAHNADVGWGPTVCDGQVAGSIGKRLEALQIWFWNGDENQSVEYQSHLQNIGWTLPRYDGTMTGTVGQGRRLEAIKIWFTPRRACPDGYYHFSEGFDLFSEGFELSAVQSGRDEAGNPICSGQIGFPCGSGSFCAENLRNDATLRPALGLTTITTTNGSTIVLDPDYVNNTMFAWYCNASNSQDDCPFIGWANKFFPGGLP